LPFSDVKKQSVRERERERDCNLLALLLDKRLGSIACGAQFARLTVRGHQQRLIRAHGVARLRLVRRLRRARHVQRAHQPDLAHACQRQVVGRLDQCRLKLLLAAGTQLLHQLTRGLQRQRGLLSLALGCARCRRQSRLLRAPLATQPQVVTVQHAAHVARLLQQALVALHLVRQLAQSLVLLALLVQALQKLHLQRVAVQILLRTGDVLRHARGAAAASRRSRRTGLHAQPQNRRLDVDIAAAATAAVCCGRLVLVTLLTHSLQRSR
jgi:hypothetical protein